MACEHGIRARLYLHDLTSEHHCGDGIDEADCECLPASVCVVCDVSTLRREALLLASGDAVGRLRSATAPDRATTH